MTLQELHAATTVLSIEHRIARAFYRSKLPADRSQIEAVMHELAHAVILFGRPTASEEVSAALGKASIDVVDAHEVFALRVELAAIERLVPDTLDRADIELILATADFKGRGPLLAAEIEQGSHEIRLATEALARVCERVVRDRAAIVAAIVASGGPRVNGVALGTDQVEDADWKVTP